MNNELKEKLATLHPLVYQLYEKDEFDTQIYLTSGIISKELLNAASLVDEKLYESLRLARLKQQKRGFAKRSIFL